MKMTLLDMVIDIMSDMDSDNVSSISSTGESEQVARIIRSVFFEMVARKDWPHLRKTLSLQNSGVLTQPNRLKIPEGVSRLDFLSYSSKLKETDDQKFRELKYMYPDEFIRHTNSRVPSNEFIDTVTIGDMELFILNDTAPTYYTSFDDEWIITDSYVKTLAHTLQGSQSQCVVYMAPSWTHENTFVPDLPAEVFPTLLAEAKSTCFLRIKEVQDQKAEQQATRGNIAMAQRNWKVKGGVRYNNYGRASRKYATGTHFNPRQFSGAVD